MLEAASPAGRALARLIAASGRGFGAERSARFRGGLLDTRRLLLSQSRAAFGPAALDSLRRGVAALGLPPGEWEDGLARAAFVHLGAEGDATLKLYLEHAVPPGAGAAGALVHDAWKWDAGSARPVRRDRYTLLPPGAARAWLGTLAGDGANELAPVARALLDWLPADYEPFSLDVRGAGEARRSLDLGLYPLARRVAELGPVLRAASRATEVPERAAEALLVERGEDALGHVALGRDGQGRPFVTVYGGRRSVAPAAVAA